MSERIPDRADADEQLLVELRRCDHDALDERQQEDQPELQQRDRASPCARDGEPPEVSPGLWRNGRRDRRYESDDPRYVVVQAPEVRRNNWREVELGFSEEACREESRRCLRCDLE